MTNINVEQYKDEGFLFVGSIFNDSEMREIDTRLSSLIANRPDDLRPEDLLNLHMTNQSIFELAAHPKAVAVAQKLLGTRDVSIFTTRILCKNAGTGMKIDWHQDSHYWPLVPPDNQHNNYIDPQVASLWLAVDDVGPDNGPMQVLPFSELDESRGKNVATVDSGGDTKGFTNFNLRVDVPAAIHDKAVNVFLKSGEASFHSAYTLHRSDPNVGERRRCAWIVRYCPTGTTVVDGKRDAFPADYPLVPVSGIGALKACPTPAFGTEMYTPCFGGFIWRRISKI
eukprot:m.84475 g.84475  ORF g.84475 m.84475 type:complete len:283 (+) comp25756_c0_seq2:82-930(+)